MRDFCFDPVLSFFLAEDNDLVIPEVPSNEAMMDPIVAFEEEPMDSGVVTEPSPSMISFFFFSFFIFLCSHLLTYLLFSCQPTCHMISMILNHP